MTSHTYCSLVPGWRIRYTDWLLAGQPKQPGSIPDRDNGLLVDPDFLDEVNAASYSRVSAGQVFPRGKAVPTGSLRIGGTTPVFPHVLFWQTQVRFLSFFFFLKILGTKH
jgi:hypothetical protein